MRKTYTICDGDRRDYEIQEKKEQIRTINEAMDYIIGVSGDYRASLDFLAANGIQTRLDCSKIDSAGMPLLAGLQSIRITLEGELEDLGRRKD